MRPNGEELVRGVQGALLAHVLPHLQDDFARQELMLSIALLNIASSEWDGAAQQLLEDNASMQALAQRGAEALTSAGHKDLAEELRAVAAESDGSARLSDLSARYARLRAAIARMAVAVEESDDRAMRALREEVVALLQRDLERRARSVLGPRADG